MNLVLKLYLFILLRAFKNSSPSATFEPVNRVIVILPFKKVGGIYTNTHRHIHGQPIDIVTNLQGSISRWSLLHSELNTQQSITISNSCRTLTHV
jgi:hypothetical protein